MKRFIAAIISSIFFFSLVSLSSVAHAQTCADTRVISDHFCNSSSSCLVYNNVCSNNTARACSSITDPNTGNKCQSCDGSSCGGCMQVCGTVIGVGSCGVASAVLSCSDAPSCQATGFARGSCQTNANGCTLGDIAQQTYGCWVGSNPGPSVPPGSSSCNSGWCTTNAECAAVGGTTGSGAGYCNPSSLVQCCVSSNSTWTPNCAWDTGPTGYGYPACLLGEGNACEGSICIPYGNNCAGHGCAAGLVGPPCFCPACQPACTPACGQADGCGGSCSTANIGVPGDIVTTTPADGGTVTVTNGQVTISWVKPTNATKYDLQLLPYDNPVCTDARAYCTFESGGGGLTTNSYTFTPQTSKYVFLVRAVNTNCTTLPGNWSSPITFTVVGGITGTVFIDQSGNAALSGSLCTADASGASIPGTGLTGTYYPATDFSGISKTRIDATVNYNWGGGAPMTGIPADNFSVRWTGKIKTGAAGSYTFSTNSDDGVRLWVNGVSVISNWTDHGPTVNTGIISLSANSVYSIQLEYYERGGGAQILLYWKKPGAATVIIPQTNLYPTANAVIGTPVQPGAGTTVETDQSGSTGSFAVGADGSYTATGQTYNSPVSLTLSPGDAQYGCTCPAGCTYGGVLPPTSDVNFFVAQVGSAWYQSIGGDVAALNPSGTGIFNPITQFCTEPNCKPYMINVTNAGDLTTGGMVMAGKLATVDLADTSGNQTSNAGPAGGSHLVVNNSSLACKENYNYFYRLYSMGTSPADDFASTASNAQKPLVAPSGNKSAYYHNGDLTIATDWALSGSESIVIFVDGDLTFTTGAHVTLPTDAFVAFIVSGDIIFDPTVGTDDVTSTTGQIQGVYIANGALRVQSVGSGNTELKFVGEGVFAACGGISLPRDFRTGGTFDGISNNRYPASLFIFRPDIMLNTPEKMKQPIINWREVAP
jgi:hypothetical protein